MSERNLHIIAFDVPYPADYGGVIDVYYKIKALSEAGIRIYLHCFEYGRKPSVELESVCEKVYYYKRITTKQYLFRDRPYIVVTRKSKELLERLTTMDFPILFEGIHSCYYLPKEQLKDRVKVVRSHNIEHDYYSNLGQIETDIFKKYYFFNESAKLKKFEHVYENASAIVAISENDTNDLTKRYSNVHHVTAFHPDSKVNIKPGIGNYALYHGNLNVGENREAALFLINKVFNDSPIRLIVAGNKPGPEIRHAADGKSNIELITDVDNEKLYELIENAQFNILPTFQATGIKLKLLAALFRGRHCIVNPFMIENTGLESLCTICADANEMKAALNRLSGKTLEDWEKKKRKNVLEKQFNNKENVQKIIPLLFGQQK